MVDKEFQEAATEVLDILTHMKTEDVNRIPKNFIAFLKENSLKTYKPEIYYTKPIEENKLKQKTYDLLGVIYLNYWANEEEKDSFLRKIDENEEKLREKYNSDNIFKNKNISSFENNVNNVALIQCKESIVKKILNKIRYIFKK